MTSNSIRRLNLVCTLACAFVVLAIAIPALAQQRSQLRTASCAYNLNRIGIGIHNYHSAYKQLPPGQGGTDGGSPETSNQGRLGSLVALLPFLEETDLWSEISKPYRDKRSGKTFPAMGPAPWYDPTVYRPWSYSPSILICPDQAGESRNANDRAVQKKVVYTLEAPSGSGGEGVLTNYVACFGDGTRKIGEKIESSGEAQRSAQASRRGIFIGNKVSRFRDVLDGLSNTIMYSETVASADGKIPKSGLATGVTGLSMNPSLCRDAIKDGKVAWFDRGRGSRWCDGAVALTGFQTVLPPNAPSCLSADTMEDLVASASSNHADGVHVLMADGAVIFVSDNVDTGSLTTPGVAAEDGYTRPGSQSPYGVWGAMGTRASKEIVHEAIRKFAKPAVRNPTSASRAGGQAGNAKERMTKWTDREGNTRLKAMFVTIEEKQTVVLLDAKGITHKVPLNSLSDRDIYRAVRYDVLARRGIQED